MTELGNIAAENYSDIEADDEAAPYAAINAYFELLPDTEEGVFDGSATISRAQAMALVMRATTPVNEAQAPETDADFTSAVGATEYTDFAAPMNEYAYLNISNGLNTKTFDGAMTRGEYICMVTNFLRSDYLEDIEANGYYDTYADADADDVTISTVSDAGDISFSDAISDATNGVPSDMYETFKTAIQHSYITEDALEDWDSPITKTEAISLFMSMSFNYTTNEGSGLVSDYIDQDDPGVKENTEIENSKWADVNGAWDAIHQFTLYARENGADATSGWCWLYYTGEGAGDQPSYAVYMKEDDPLYGTVYHLGDYLPNGEQFVGKGVDEYTEVIHNNFEDLAEEQGYETYIDEDGSLVIVVD
jgi:hypothetical protein